MEKRGGKVVIILCYFRDGSEYICDILLEFIILPE